jgi:citrate synthase
LAPKKSVQLSGVVVAQSAISSIDAEEGVLMYRGYEIAELAEHSTYEEVAFLLLHGELPTSAELAAFGEQLGQRAVPSNVAEIVDEAGSTAVPMDVLRTAVSALAFSDPDRSRSDRDAGLRKAARLAAQLPTIIARFHRRRGGLEPIDPDASLSYAENFLTMLHGEQPTQKAARAFDIAMILHAEHEMNASTFAARVVTGTGADMHAAIVAGIAALSGPLHGGANEAAMKLFERFGSAEQTPDEVRVILKRKEKLHGFGHPLYRAYDPRATILKRISREFLSALSSLSRARPNDCNEAGSGPARYLTKDAINGARNSTRSREATVGGDDWKRPEQVLRCGGVVMPRAEQARSRSTREGPAGQRCRVALPAKGDTAGSRRKLSARKGLTEYAAARTARALRTPTQGCSRSSRSELSNHDESVRRHTCGTARCIRPAAAPSAARHRSGAANHDRRRPRNAGCPVTENGEAP